MEFVCYDDWEQLPDSADSLFSRAAESSLFFSRRWFENLTRNALDETQKTVLACVIEGDEIQAILPLMKRSTEHWLALTNLYSSLYTLLLTENNQREVIGCLARGLTQLPFSSLRLEPIAEDDRNLDALQEAMESLGVNCQRRFRFYNWVHHTRGQTFQEYMAERPARVRNTIARKARKLKREHGFRIQLFCELDLPQAMADYNAVYNRSWKANELYGEFIDGLASTLSEAGWLRLAILYVGERPVAAQFWFVLHGKASIFKLVYDQEWKHYSPGSILTGFLMEHVIETDKVSEIDFLTGNDAYKQDWMSERRERQVLSCIAAPKPKHNGGHLVKWLRVFMKQRKR